MFFLVFSGFRIPEGSSSIHESGRCHASLTRTSRAGLPVSQYFPRPNYNPHMMPCNTSTSAQPPYVFNVPNDDPSGILNPGKTRKNIHTGFFEPHNFPKGWGQVSNKYIQHIYSYSTLSNYSKAQHGRGNEFANTIQWLKKLSQCLHYFQYSLYSTSNCKNKDKVWQYT